MNHGSLFSGIGGFDLASEWMGWENVFHCEWNEFGQKILKHYWPESISYGDITKTDFTIHRGNIDILTGGFPCQPYSVAGQRKGTEDARHLWPEMLRAIRECKPTWIVGENVPGLISWSKGLVFEQVCIDLENEGYEVQPVILPACGINAPHKRERIWFIAYSDNSGGGNRMRINGINEAQNEGRQKQSQFKSWENLEYSAFPDAPYPGGEQLQERTPIRNRKDSEKEGTGLDNRTKRSGNAWDAANSDSRKRLQRRLHQGRPEEAERHAGTRYARSNERRDWKDFPTVAPICGRDDGLSYGLDNITFSKWRNESIKAMGNAIVPQIAYQIFKAIEQIK